MVPPVTIMRTAGLEKSISWHGWRRTRDETSSGTMLVIGRTEIRTPTVILGQPYHMQYMKPEPVSLWKTDPCNQLGLLNEILLSEFQKNGFKQTIDIPVDHVFNKQSVRVGNL